jgi:hypothetical protein
MIIDENELVKEVFAQFGLAIYLLQVIEHGCVNLLISLKLSDKSKITKKQIEGIYKENFKKTFGTLIKNIPKSIINTNFLNELNNTRKLRNELCHSYFKKRAVAFTSINGREKIIIELKENCQYLENIDKELDKVVYKISKQFGINSETIENVYVKKVLEEGDESYQDFFD